MQGEFSDAFHVRGRESGAGDEKEDSGMVPGASLERVAVDRGDDGAEHEREDADDDDAGEEREGGDD